MKRRLADVLKSSDAIIAELVELAPVKTWSLIVTLFGDLGGETLTGAQIRNLLGRIGIKPEAIRVAMHRLKKEGWIVADRQGREAIYRLSKRGIRETHAAYADVYRQDTKFRGGWRCVLTDGDTNIGPPGFAISKDIALIPADVPTDPAMLALPMTDQHIPDWLQAQLLPPGFIAMAMKLSDVVKTDLQPDQANGLLNRAVQRLLVLHHWRRIALRGGAWVLISLMPHGDLARCHRVVSRFLVQTTRIKAGAEHLESNQSS